MKDLTITARTFLLATLAAGIALASWHLIHLEAGEAGVWLSLSALAAIAHTLNVQGATPKSSYQVSLTVYALTYLLLGIPATIFVILVAHLVDWVWHRYPWFIQTFNLSTFVLSASAAHWVFGRIHSGAGAWALTESAATLAALLAFTLVNHLLIGVVLKLARGESFEESGLFSPLSLMIDFTLLCLGAMAAVLWEVRPFAILFILPPLYLLFTTLKIPSLERQTQIDPKTGLFNARYFALALENELARADRFDRPLTTIIGDLDLLRNINNTYGHLAGDRVLIDIARMLKESFRDYDVVSRFGGEEFAILMPEITPEQAQPRVEAIRRKIEAAEFDIPTSMTPIKATVSFGIAGREHAHQEPADLIHKADLALYHAKLIGRNQTTVYCPDRVGDNLPDTPRRPSAPDGASFEARLDLGSTSYQPPPLRKRSSLERSGAPPRPTTPRPLWISKAYSVLVALAALAAVVAALRTPMAVDWMGLGLFILLVLLSEALSIEIFARDTYVSTVTAPMIAGALLFGPAGAIALGLAQAITSAAKFQSDFDHWLFSAGNQVLSSLAGILPLVLLGTSIQQQPLPLRIGLTCAASGVLYLSGTLLAALSIHLESSRPMMEIWRQRYFWLIRYRLGLGVVAFALVEAYRVAGGPGVLVVLAPLLMLRFSQVRHLEATKHLAHQLNERQHEVERRAGEIEQTNAELWQALSQIIDLRDPFVLGHSLRVARYARMIAEELDLPPGRIAALEKAGLLHDVGKVGVRDAVFLKADPLTRQEYETVTQHTLLGAEILQNHLSAHELLPILRHQHERFDGNGYPEQLKGQDIPIEARILCLSDALDAMASRRPYRQPLANQDILEEIQSHAGTQFDPIVVKAFLNLAHRLGESVFLDLRGGANDRTRHFGQGRPSPSANGEPHTGPDGTRRSAPDPVTPTLQELETSS